MARVAQFVVSGLLAATLANGQSFDGTARSEDAFSYVQPKNTTILGPYGHSPAVLPSRMFLLDPYLYNWTLTDLYHSKCYCFR